MLYFKTHHEDALCALEKLPTIFAIEEIEPTIFRPCGMVLQEAGCWARLLAKLAGSSEIGGSGHSCGVHWKLGSRAVRLEGKHFAAVRFARWAEIRIGNEILIAAFLPHVYSHPESGNHYADHRFVVACSNEDILPLVMLFTDVITGNAEGDSSWETASPSSTNTG